MKTIVNFITNFFFLFFALDFAGGISMKLSKSPVILLLLGVLVSTSLVCQAQQPGVLGEKILVRGRVVDANRAAVRGARVSARSVHPPVDVVTDQNGEFSLSLEPDEYSVKVLAEGFLDSTAKLDARQPGQTLEVMLEVGIPSATVTVTDLGGYQIGAVSSATRTITLLRDTPQSIAVVSKEQIQDQSMASIADVV